MAKKRFTHDEAYDEDEELLLDRKAKRKRERELERQRQESRQDSEPAADDPMVRMVSACQENRWREASVICPYIEVVCRCAGKMRLRLKNRGESLYIPSSEK